MSSQHFCRELEGRKPQKFSLEYAAWDKEEGCCYDVHGLGTDLTGATRGETTDTEKLGRMWTLVEATSKSSRETHCLFYVFEWRIWVYCV